jgi:hypothetical protein
MISDWVDEPFLFDDFGDHLMCVSIAQRP